MASNNPYSLGYAAIWTAFNAWRPWTAIVRPGMTTQVNEQAPGFQPVPPNASQPGDRVSIKLLERRLGINPYKRNSLSVMLACNYTLILDTGKYGPDTMNLISIECLRAIMAIDPTQKIGLGSLLYDWDPIDASARVEDSQSNRPEWSAAWGIKLTFSMDRTIFLESTFT